MAIVTHLVCYDIASNKRRSKVAAKLQAYGDRIQESVFLISATPEQLETVEQEVADLIDTSIDRLFVLPVCKRCNDSVTLHGQMTLPSEDIAWSL